ncbi:MAG TPA: hypothetical protein VK021_09175 [Flavobacteriaceae bacterium]|nr:hypothetical protein [Flavobacteriaceae bacterium]
MKLFKRFAYYLGGFSIGIIMVFFIWGGKETSCAYFPNARVLKEIRSKTTEFSPAALTFFNENNIDTIAVNKIFHQGKVHFAESRKGRDVECRVYVISGKHQDHHLQVYVEECEETNTIATIIDAGFRKEED